MPLKNVNLGISDLDLSSWKKGTENLRRIGGEVSFLQAVGLLFDKADEAERFLAGAQADLDRLIAAVNAKEQAHIAVSAKLRDIEQTFEAERAKREALLVAPLKACQQDVAAKIAALEADLAATEAKRDAAVAEAQRKIDAIQAGLRARQAAAEEELAALANVIADREEKLRTVTAALDAIKAKIG